jgi:hypothetical protein
VSGPGQGPLSSTPGADLPGGRLHRKRKPGTYHERFGRSTPYLTRELADGASYAECAQALGVSVARVGQLEHTGLARLRRCLELIETGTSVDDAIAVCRGRVGRPRKGAK